MNPKPTGETLDDLMAVAEKFALPGKVAGIREYGSGNINRTYLVTLDAGEEKRIVLQRINADVFSRPERVMQNLRVISDHVRGRLEVSPPEAGRRWEVPHPLAARDGGDRWIGPDGSFWRAVRFVENARTFDTIQSADHAREVGYALGTFQNLLSDLPADRLASTLEGFHVTPRYLSDFDRAMEKKRPRSSPEVDHALKIVAERRKGADVLEAARAAGRLVLRPIHGDPKVNNVMVEETGGRAVAMIDLDTAGPGLIHYDVGDCLRSACNPLGEEAERWEAVRFEPDLCRAVLSGYLPAAGAFLSETDREYMYEAVRLIAFELGLRFLTDYLLGNVYFRVRDEDHNLRRALVQFRLAESIEAQQALIQGIVGASR